MESNFVDFVDQCGIHYGGIQPRLESFSHQAKKTLREKKKGEKGRKGKSREKLRRKEVKREKEKGEEHGSKGERRRRVMAATRMRRKSP